MKKKMKKRELEINRALEYVCAWHTWRMRNVPARDIAWKLMKSRHKRILPRHSTHTHTQHARTLSRITHTPCMPSKLRSFAGAKQVANKSQTDTINMHNL